VILLRHGMLADASLIATIQRDSWIAAMPWLPRTTSTAEDEAFFRDHVLASATVLIAEDSGQARGFIEFRPGWIDQLYVCSSDRGQGVGTTLLRAALEQLSQPVRLYTFQRNLPARRFYEKHGFEPEAFGDGSTNVEREPDVLYRLGR
jgi:ribosomal protein S18 acetylase RimI-like enzyme